MPKFAFTPEQREALLANIFPASHASVDPIKDFFWHTGKTECDSHLEHSSQALAIDFFGTLQGLNQIDRNRVFDDMAASLGLPLGGDWKVDLEWMDQKNVMNEWRLTQIDAKAESSNAVILFEAKFGESDGGRCSQPFSLVADKPQCNGNYEWQTNPKNGIQERCALSGKGIRYWEVVPEVMSITASQDHRPCPFSNSSYQWMRNLTLAYEYGKRESKPAALMIVYADHAGLPFPAVLRSPRWSQFVDQIRQDRITLRTKSYQELCASAVVNGTSDDSLLRELQTWISAKIERIGAARQGKSTKA